MQNQEKQIIQTKIKSLKIEICRLNMNASIGSAVLAHKRNEMKLEIVGLKKELGVKGDSKNV